MIEAAVFPARIRAGIETDLVIRLTNPGPGSYTNVHLAVRLPAGFVRLRGKTKMRWAVLSPGGSVSETIQVKAAEAGTYRIVTSSFSYLDYQGSPCHPPVCGADIRVIPPEPRPETSAPRVEPLTEQLPLNSWHRLRVRVSNPGQTAVSDVKVALAGPLIRGDGSSRQEIGNLGAGTSREASFQVWVSEPGAYVPLRFEVTYCGPEGKGEATMTSTISVHGKPNLQRARILFLAANPQGTHRLRIDQEIREIREEIERGKERENIEVKESWAVRARDVSRELINVQPQFVHFAGHGGGGDESFVAENEVGEPEILRVGGLARAFKAAGEDIRCVVVNACSTKQLAYGLKDALPRARVIGMRRPVGDEAAINFSIGFYQAVAGGRSIEQSYELGLAQMEMRSRDEDDEGDGGPPFLL